MNSNIQLTTKQPISGTFGLISDTNYLKKLTFSYYVKVAVFMKSSVLAYSCHVSQRNSYPSP